MYFPCTEGASKHNYGPVRVSGKAGAAAEPKVQGRAYEGSLPGFPYPDRGLVVQKLLFQLIKVVVVLLELIEAVLVSVRADI